MSSEQSQQVASIKELGKAVKRGQADIRIHDAGLCGKIRDMHQRLADYVSLGYTQAEAYRLVSSTSFNASLLLELTKDYTVEPDGEGLRLARS